MVRGGRSVTDRCQGVCGALADDLGGGLVGGLNVKEHEIGALAVPGGARVGGARCEANEPPKAVRFFGHPAAVRVVETEAEDRTRLIGRGHGQEKKWR